MNSKIDERLRKIYTQFQRIPYHAFIQQCTLIMVISQFTSNNSVYQ